MAKIFGVEIDISTKTEEELIEARIQLSELLSEVNHSIKAIQQCKHKYSSSIKD